MTESKPSPVSLSLLRGGTYYIPELPRTCYHLQIDGAARSFGYLEEGNEYCSVEALVYCGKCLRLVDLFASTSPALSDGAGAAVKRQYELE